MKISRWFQSHFLRLAILALGIPLAAFVAILSRSLFPSLGAWAAEIQTVVLVATAWLVAVYAWWTRDLVTEARRPHLGMWSTPQVIYHHGVSAWDKPLGSSVVSKAYIIVNVANVGPGGMTDAVLECVWEGTYYSYSGPLSIPSQAKERYVVLYQQQPPNNLDRWLSEHISQSGNGNLRYRFSCQGVSPWNVLKESERSELEVSWMKNQGTNIYSLDERVIL